jgi:hypothetical protein
MSPLEMDDELTPEERERFAALPRERDPGRLLEERTVRALRDRGLVRPAQAPRRAVRFHPGWLTGAIAAGIALFLGGLTTGQYVATRSVVAVVQQHDQRQAAQLVQQTGSAYVQALAHLSQASNTTAGVQGRQGREVAQAMLRAAADEVVRMSPNDPVATGILAAFDRAGVQQQAAAAGHDTASKQSVVWF